MAANANSGYSTSAPSGIAPLAKCGPRNRHAREITNAIVTDHMSSAASRKPKNRQTCWYTPIAVFTDTDNSTANGST